MWIKLIPYAAAALVSAYVSWYVTSNSYDDDIEDLKAKHAVALTDTQKAQIAECDKAQDISGRIDNETHNAKSGTDDVYIAELERMLKHSRAAAATCRANAASSSIVDGKAQAGFAGTCETNSESLRIGYDGQRNGEIAAGLQKYICETKPETIGCD